MNGCGVRSHRNIFCDGGEARTCLSGADLHLWFTWKLMRQNVALRHARSVFACSGCEGGVPMESRQTLRGTFTVKVVKEGTFSGGYFSLRVNGVKSDQQRNRGQCNDSKQHAESCAREHGCRKRDSEGHGRLLIH